jgi:hypothetical protein
LSKALVRRLERIEQPTTTPKLRVVTHEEFNGVYNIDQKQLSKEEFEVWAASLDSDVELIMVEIVCNAKGTVHCDTTCSFGQCEVRKDRLNKPDDKCKEVGEHE